jgi:peptide/nickel transport system ATP-binding protein
VVVYSAQRERPALEADPLKLDNAVSTPLLKVRDLAVSFASATQVSTPVLAGVDFEIQAGERVGLLGPSGCGKSTLVMALLNLLPATARVTSGSVQFRNLQLLDLPEAHLRQIRGSDVTVVFQEPALSLNPVRRVGDQVADVIAAHRDWPRARCRQEAHSILTAVHLHDTARIYSSYPHQLSGGERQRIAIAQAVACEPSLIIADEPTTSLDPAVQAEVLALFREMNQRLNTASLFISHNPAVLAQVADRVLVLERGRIIAQGSLDQIWSSRRPPFANPISGPDREDASESQVVITQSPGGRPKPIEEQGMASLRFAKRSPILMCRSLTKIYHRHDWLGRRGRQVRALEDVTLNLSQGQTLALVGESGSGKSTLARCLTRFEQPTSGEVRFGGRNTSSFKLKELFSFRRQIQLILQDPATAMNPRLSALEVIIEPLMIQGIGSRSEQVSRAVGLMKQVGLDPTTSNRHPLEFSGGQRQRLVLARALALEPKVIIFDEALSGLDLAVQAKILKLLARLQSERALAYLLITHDLTLALQFADEIAVMHQGRIVEQAPAEDLLRNPQHAQTRILLDCVPRSEPTRPCVVA